MLLPLVLAGYRRCGRSAPAARRPRRCRPARRRHRGRRQPRGSSATEVSVGCFDDHDRRARPLEGEQPGNATRSSRREVDRPGPELPGAPPWPELAADLTARRQGRRRSTSARRCASTSSEVTRFWREHPGEKAKLAAQAVWMLWRPVRHGRADTPESGLASRLARDVVEPALRSWRSTRSRSLGLARLPRRFLALTLLLLAYGTRDGDGLRRHRALPRPVGLPALHPGRDRRSRAHAPPALRIRGRREPAREGRPRPPPPRRRRLRAPSADAPPRSARARRRRHASSASTTASPSPFYAQLDRARVSRTTASGRRATSTRRWRSACGARSARRGPTSSTPTSCTPTSTGLRPPARTAIVSTKHNDDPFRLGLVPPRRAPLRATGAARDLHHRCARALQRRARRSPGGEAVGRPLRPRRAPGRLGATRRPDAAAEARVLLAVSRLERAEGPRRRDRGARAGAASGIRMRFSSFSGSARRRLRSRPSPRRAAIADAVHLAGSVGDVADWLRRAELFVHPARWEGFGLALLEAMLAGLPDRRERGQLDPRDRRRRRHRASSSRRTTSSRLPTAIDTPARRPGTCARSYGAAGLERARTSFSVADDGRADARGLPRRARGRRRRRAARPHRPTSPTE